MDKVDFDELIIRERNKIWEDKLKLTKQSEYNNYSQYPDACERDDNKVDEYLNNADRNLENVSPNQNVSQILSPRHYVGALSKHSPFSYVVSECESNAKYTGKLLDPNRHTLPITKANTEPRMATMVRFGEYSPLNPNLLSPGKTLLGLGEYEEKRRQLMNRKKQEYREYLAQARQFGSNSSTPTKPNEITKKTNLFFNSINNNFTPGDVHDGKKLLPKSDHASTNTAPTNHTEYVKLSNILSDSGSNPYTKNYSPNDNGNVPLFLTNASTNTTPERVSRDVQTEPDWNLGTVNLHLTERNQTLTSPDEHLWTSSLTSNNVRNRGSVGRNEAILDVSSQTVEKSWPENPSRQVATHEPAKFLSPRERKLADLQESGAQSPSLGLPDTSAGDGLSPTVLKTQREAYKEELRKQIEEKQRLDAELREKARVEEEVIAKRVTQQQERMRQEFLREEAEKKERQMQRCSQMEEFRRRQEENKKAERERYLRTKSSSKDLPEEPGSSLANVDPRVDHSAQLLCESPLAEMPPARIHRKQDRQLAEPSLREHNRKSSVERPVASVRNEKVDLDDSLPIPVFRARSPVIPALRTSAEMGQDRASANSKEMQMLEAKWQVPAVQKTSFAPTAGFLGDGSKGCPKTILTQLGAFRRQLQIEQMRMEEIVQRRNQPNII